MAGRGSAEAKASAESLSVKIICPEASGDTMLEPLDKSYAVHVVNNLDADLAK